MIGPTKRPKKSWTLPHEFTNNWRMFRDMFYPCLDICSVCSLLCISRREENKYFQLYELWDILVHVSTAWKERSFHRLTSPILWYISHLTKYIFGFLSHLKSASDRWSASSPSEALDRSRNCSLVMEPQGQRDRNSACFTRTWNRTEVGFK